MRQRYSLTILTVIADSEFNGFLHFQGLKFFYLESFCLSKVFIIFVVGREGANTLARFLQGGRKSIMKQECRLTLEEQEKIETPDGAGYWENLEI